MTAGEGVRQPDDVHLDEPRDQALMRREWTVQRIGWVTMLLLVIAAFFGLLGPPGLASTATVTSAGGTIAVEYPRVDRHHSPSTLVIEIAPDAVENGEVRLWISRDAIDTLTVDFFIPEPESVQVEPDRVVYTFTADAAGQPIRITLKYEHDSFWRQEIDLGLVDGDAVSFSPFVLP